MPAARYPLATISPRFPPFFSHYCDISLGILPQFCDTYHKGKATATRHTERTAAMLTITRYPHKIFTTEAEAAATVALLGFEDGETRIQIDPKGSGRCLIEVLDLETGEVIGKI
jgi:hypothetical protein